MQSQYYVCPKCKRVFSILDTLYSHVVREHSFWFLSEDETSSTHVKTVNYNETENAPQLSNNDGDFVKSSYSSNTGGTENKEGVLSPSAELPSPDNVSGSSVVRVLMKQLEKREAEVQKLKEETFRYLEEKSAMKMQLEEMKYLNSALQNKLESFEVEKRETESKLNQQEIEIRKLRNTLEEASHKDLETREKIEQYVDVLTARMILACKKIRELKEKTIALEQPIDTSPKCCSQNASHKSRSIVVQNNPSTHRNGLTTHNGRHFNNSINVFKLVFYYLDSSSLATCRRVCRKWRRVLEKSSYWVNVAFVRCSVSNKVLKSVSNLCSATKSITLQEITCSKWKRSDEPDDTFERGYLEPGLGEILKVAQHSLEHISIIMCGQLLTERCLWLASCHCPHLKQLAYANDFNSASPESLWALGSGCRNLQTLIVPPMNSKKFTNRCALMIGKCWPDLQSLCIGGTEINIEGLTAIARFCQKLKILELDHMGEIQESAATTLCQLGLKKLQRFFLTHTPISSFAVVHIYSNCRNLQKLKIVVSIEDYYAFPNKKQKVQEYRKRMRDLLVLQDRPGLGQVLEIHML